MTIHVTAQHIKDGKRNDCCICPVALAMKDAGFPTAMVGTERLHPYTGLPALPYELHKRMEKILTMQLEGILSPRTVVNFVLDFDAGKQVEPFSFELDAEPTYKVFPEEII